MCKLNPNLNYAILFAIAACTLLSSTKAFAAQNDRGEYTNGSFIPQTGNTVVSPSSERNSSPLPVRETAQTAGKFTPSTSDESTKKLRKASWHSSVGVNTTGKKSEKRTVPGSSSSLWTTFGTLAVMVVGILLIARLAKRKTGLRSQTIPSEAMEILGRKTVDPQNGIILIRCGSRILMLGASDNGLRTLCEINDPLEIDYLSGMCRTDDSETSSAISFQSLFRRQTGTSPESAATNSTTAAKESDENLKNRLLQMLNKRGGPS